MKKKASKILIYSLIAFWVCYLLGFGLTCAVRQRFDIRYLASLDTLGFFALFVGLAVMTVLLYYYKHYWLLNSKNIIKGKQSDLHLAANLEQSRFESDEEIDKNFTTVDFDELKGKEIAGTPIKAVEADGHLRVTFAKPSHSLIIGTTGSGKTTTFVSPTIQILSELKNHPSMLISDPKGELYADHSEALKAKGYEVKVLDLRNPYNSVRWNPLERPYLLYQRALHLDDEVKEDEERGCWTFDGTDYFEKEKLDSAIQVKRQLLNDMVYEDLNDICTVLCPVTNKDEPMWESGAKNFILAIALAMLEDSADPTLGMSKEKYNFFSLTKVATSTDDDCKELLDYFKHRSPLSKAVSLSKQVLDSSDKTRGSYLSSTFDKLSMFSDLSLCALTSENEIEFGTMGEKPTALFLQIPDEKETRHTLASMVILQAYKELVYKANTYPELSLPRPVYFILDEFGNLPKIHKLEQMVTVGRSRNIWLNLVIQSYSQLAKTYDEKAADIIKGNCNIQVFIGTTDLKTIEDFSKRCGNYSIVQRSVGFNSSKGEDINSNSTVKERPLIYPSELQILNRPGDMGHAIVTVFGYYPIQSVFTPCFEVSQYSMKRVSQKLIEGRWFDEARAYYDLRKRNALINVVNAPSAKANPLPLDRKEQTKNALIIKQIVAIACEGVEGILSPQAKEELEKSIRAFNFQEALATLTTAEKRAEKNGMLACVEKISDAQARLLKLMCDEGRPENVQSQGD
jgi:type IV secretion system protein VirD4